MQGHDSKVDRHAYRHVMDPMNKGKKHIKMGVRNGSISSARSERQLLNIAGINGPWVHVCANNRKLTNCGKKWTGDIVDRV